MTRELYHCAFTTDQPTIVGSISSKNRLRATAAAAAAASAAYCLRLGVIHIPLDVSGPRCLDGRLSVSATTDTGRLAGAAAAAAIGWRLQQLTARSNQPTAQRYLIYCM